ncbi:MAG: KH domain-containing protein [Clostridiales bacterium]|nr:KH domain-containing protein [Clostridiales bacterium]
MTIEVTAKKVEDAIKQGLEQLKASLDEVSVEVLDSGGFLRKAKVRLTLEREEEVKQEIEPKQQPKSEQPEKHEQSKEQQPEKPQKKQAEATEQPQKTHEKKAAPKPKKKPEQTKVTAEPVLDEAEPEKAEEEKTEKEQPRPVNSEEVKKAIAGAREFIEELVKKMGFTDTSVSVKENGDVDITAPAGDDSLIIGRHGETLSAISFLAETLARAEKQHVNIVADCNGYRERRAASLTSMAKRRANECAAKHRKIKLEPMERVDRRTIHNALSGDDRVTTASEGKEPYRYIVILPKKKGQ